MLKIISKPLFLFLLVVNSSNCSNIVFLHHLASYSHMVSSMPLAEALASKGHNITYIAAFPLRSTNPNISYIVPKNLKDFMEILLDQACDISTRIEERLPNWLAVSNEIELAICSVLLQSEEVHRFVNTTSPVDLMYIDSFPGPDCGLGLAYKLKTKVSLFMPIPVVPRLIDALGLSSESSTIPTWDLRYKMPLSFINRIRTSLVEIGWRFHQLINWSGMESIIKDNLNLEYLPSLDQLYENINVVLLSGHFIDEHRRSLPPMFINVPSLHVKDTHKPLSKEIQEFINSPGQDGKPSLGFIYISFGTVVKAPKLPQDTREVFFNSMKAFPNIRFLWRWDGEFPKDKPKNLFLSKWFEQQDLLAHPKMKGFITQLGRPSSHEAILNSVPTITFPILGDQDYTANLFGDMGLSVNLEIVDVTEEQLKNALGTILYDKKMKERIAEVSNLYTDLPMKPIETAVWWTEYVLRHNNTDHLKPLAMKQTWYQRRLLDVWGFLTISFILLTYFVLAIFRFLTKLTNVNFSLSSTKFKVQ